MSRHSHTRSVAVPLQWDVNGLRIAGLAWGDSTQKPLLALHGWLDNAASFVHLAPLLENYYVVAPDLTGHGLSSLRSADASYQIWDDLPEILGVLTQLEWDTFALLGHSRGAIIATLLASAYAERVDHLILLDAVTPPPVADDQFAQQMRKALDEKPQALVREPRVYGSVDEAIQSRLRGGRIGEKAARILVERNLQACEGGFSWTTDARLHTASAVKLTPGQTEAVMQALVMPVLLLLAEDSNYHAPALAETAQRAIQNLLIENVSGGHNFHMEENVQNVALRILEFLSASQR